MEDKQNKTSIKDLNVKDFWYRLWKLLAPSHKQIKILFGFVMVFELSRLIAPYILKIIIDMITDFHQENIGKIILLIGAIFAANQLVVVIDYFVDKKIMAILAEAEMYLPVNAHRKMLFLPLSFHEKENTGYKVSKIQRGVDKMINFLGNFFWDVGPTVIQLILTAATLLAVDWRFGAVFCLFVPIFVYLTLRSNKKVYPLRKARQEDYDASAGIMTQAVININTVQSFVQEKREERNFAEYRKKIKNNLLDEFAIKIKYDWGRSFIIDIGRAMILFFGVYLVWIGGITIGSLIFITTISEKALIAIFRISRLYDRIMESSEAIDRLYFLNQEESDLINNDKRIKPKTIFGAIKFDNVDFSYGGNKAKALDKVNLKINSGCVTALVGPSGGGKTTVARMIYRHYDPQSGRVFLDDRDLKDYDLRSFRKFIAIVPQEVEIFNASARDNIAYAKPDASLREIIAAAKIANADEFIENLSDGYNTKVGERGIKLSGGQRQRVGIARAVLANPRILIFDEATSNLDSWSEKLIQDSMHKIIRGRTVVIIAHRLSTIKRADKIIVLEEGKVVEDGSHLELAQIGGGLYAKLLNLQKMGDVE
jgi:ABC-type multidrug transport system fused ATPase/permease subunit